MLQTDLQAPRHFRRDVRLYLLSALLTAAGTVAFWLYFRSSGRDQTMDEEHGAALDTPEVVP